MFVKMYQYHIRSDKVEEYLHIQEQAFEIYSRYLQLHTMYFKSNEDDTKWVEISRYKDEAEYKKSISIINEHTEIQALFAQFQSLLDPEKSEIREEDFMEMKSFSKDIGGWI